MKIGYIISSLAMGGAQSHLLKLCTELTKRGNDITIYCIGEIDNILMQRFPGLTIQQFDMRCIWTIVFWREFLRLIRKLKKDAPPLIHTYCGTSDVFGVIAARAAKVPVVISSRRDPGLYRYSRRMKYLETVTARMSDSLVCVSRETGDIAVLKEKIDPRKVVVITNGVEIGDEKGASQYPPYTVGMVAAMDRLQKGQIYLIDAAKIILGSRNDVRFVLVGDGHLRTGYEKRVHAKGVHEYFKFTGKQSDVFAALKTFDIFALSSEGEGCSNALLEAMAVGLPCIVTSTPANKEVITDGETGFLMPPKDPAALAAKILEVLSDPEKMRQVGANARKRVLEHFSLDTMVDNYISLYTELVNRKSKKNG